MVTSNQGENDFNWPPFQIADIGYSRHREAVVPIGITEQEVVVADSVGSLALRQVTYST